MIEILGHTYYIDLSELENFVELDTPKSVGKEEGSSAVGSVGELGCLGVEGLSVLFGVQSLVFGPSPAVRAGALRCLLRCRCPHRQGGGRHMGVCGGQQQYCRLP